MNPLIVDLLLILLIVLALFRGYQRGLVVSLLGLIGFLGGAIVGLIYAPSLVDSLPAIPRLLALLAILLLLANIGQALTMYVARTVRELLLWRPLRIVDSTAGAAFTIIGTIILVWVTAAVLRVAPYQPVTVAISESKVVSIIDKVVPDLARTTMAKARQVINEGTFPNVFSALGPEPYFDALPPDQEVLNTPAIERASQSVARITGVSTSCRRAIEGSGFVIAKDLVMTNAHVVAGLANPRVRINGASGDSAGKVVYFDPEKDIAIIAISTGTTPVLALKNQAGRGDDAVVAGFPENGPFALTAARIKGEITAIGWDIYSKERVRRDVFALAAEVRPGNSGGPLFAVDGEVVGMVFARSTTDDSTGYALTHQEIRDALAKLGAKRNSTDTGECA